MKLILTLASLAIIYKSTMDTGDPTSLFSNLLVFYAMYWLSYIDNSHKLKEGFLKATRTVIFIVGFICFVGWLDILTILESNEQFFIAFSQSMRLGDTLLINVHTFFYIIAIKLAVISALEWTVGLNATKTVVSKSRQLKNAEGA